MIPSGTLYWTKQESTQEGKAMIRRISLTVAAMISMVGIFAAPAYAKPLPSAPTQHRTVCYQSVCIPIWYWR